MFTLRTHRWFSTPGRRGSAQYGDLVPDAAALSKPYCQSGRGTQHTGKANQGREHRDLFVLALDDFGPRFRRSRVQRPGQLPGFVAGSLDAEIDQIFLEI